MNEYPQLVIQKWTTVQFIVQSLPTYLFIFDISDSS